MQTRGSSGDHVELPDPLEVGRDQLTLPARQPVRQLPPQGFRMSTFGGRSPSFNDVGRMTSVRSFRRPPRRSKDLARRDGTARGTVAGSPHRRARLRRCERTARAMTVAR